jgi:hypothetical protein
MATNYGSDTTCVSDTPIIDLQISDPQQVIGQRIARRLQTPRGGLAAIGDDPNFGLDIRQYTLARMNPSQLSQAQSQIAAECTKDEEVSAADVTIQFTNGGPMTVTIQLTSAAGPFTLTLAVSALTTALIFGG